jgi:imidazolonepropionase-like amidohydrolase
MTATLYRGAAFTDARSDRLQVGVSLLAEDRTVTWIVPTGEEPDPGPGARVVDAGGGVIVPAMVDSHSHVSLPGGSHWIARIDDSAEELLRVAEENGARLVASGIRWARDVGSPARRIDGRERAVTLAVKDRWMGRADRPYIRAAGTWIGKQGALPGAGFLVEARDGDDLARAVERQLDDGTDLVKLYMDGPDGDTSPFTVHEVQRVVDLASGRGAAVAAHATQPGGARAAVLGGVTSVEHGEAIDDDLAGEMARRGTFLVTTHAVMKSWLSFGSTTDLERFTGGRDRILERLERARASVGAARRAGVAIAAGSDFGGGSLRAGHLAWEVESLVEAGLEPWEALAAATWRGGELLGEPGAGVISQGGPSDCFLVHGNPLEDPSALWRVWAVL